MSSPKYVSLPAVDSVPKKTPVPLQDTENPNVTVLLLPRIRGDAPLQRGRAQRVRGAARRDRGVTPKFSHPKLKVGWSFLVWEHENRSIP